MHTVYCQCPTLVAFYFRTLTGKSIAADILAVRLEKAKSLLSETNRVLDVIAADCGFCDASHLCSVFRRELGINVPREVAVLGVDNDPLLCDFTNPTISSVDPNPFEIGYQAAQALVQWIDDPKHKPKDIKPAPIGLVERMSTQVFPFPEPWMSDALVYIRRNIARNINASEVISFLKLSHTTVEKAFRVRLGVSVRQEIAKVRIDEAKRLLEKTALPLAEACSLSGFSSKAYFTAAFNEATGTTPLEWRITKRRHP